MDVIRQAPRGASLGRAGRRDAAGGAAQAVTVAVLAVALLAVPVTAGALGAGSSNPQAQKRYDQGMDRLRAGNWPDAASEFAEAVAADPKFVDAYMRLGEARGRMRHFTEAAVSFEKALAIEPDNVDARLGLASALVESDVDDRAESEARRVLAVAESRSEPYILLGRIYLRRAETREDPAQKDAAYGKAVEHLTRAVELRSVNADYRWALAVALLRAGRLAEGTEQLREAARLDPGNSIYHRELGEANFVLERYAEASAHLLLAHADQKQRSGPLYVLLMRAAYHLGLYPEAAEWARWARNASPNDANVLLLSGTIHRYLGDQGRADQFIRQALLVDPRLPGADYELGMLCFDRGEFREAIESLRKAAEDAPTDYRAWYQLGLAYRCQGLTADSDRALARFKELKDREQEEKERAGIEAGPPDRLIAGPATRPAREAAIP